MSQFHFSMIAVLLLMTTVTYASCSKEHYEQMDQKYELLKKRVEYAYINKKIIKDNYQYFTSTLDIIKFYLNSYLSTIQNPITSSSPDQDQCESIENQIDDVIAGLTQTLEVEMPQQAEPIAPLALRPERQGPSPKVRIPTDIIPDYSQPYVQTPQSSIQTDIPPIPPMAVPKEPQPSIPNY